MTALEFKKSLHNGDKNDKTTHPFIGRCLSLEIHEELFFLELNYDYKTSKWYFLIIDSNPLISGIESAFYNKTESAEKDIIKYITRTKLKRIQKFKDLLNKKEV